MKFKLIILKPLVLKNNKTFKIKVSDSNSISTGPTLTREC